MRQVPFTNYMENTLRPLTCNKDSDCGSTLICFLLKCEGELEFGNQLILLGYTTEFLSSFASTEPRKRDGPNMLRARPSFFQRPKLWGRKMTWEHQGRREREQTKLLQVLPVSSPFLAPSHVLLFGPKLLLVRSRTNTI